VRPLASRTGVLSGEGALSVFTRARELEARGHDIIHLELGEPDFHPDAPVLEAVKAALDAGQDRYSPPPGLPILQGAIAEYLAQTRGLSVAPSNIVIAPGCKMMLSLVGMAIIEPGDEVLYPDPGFPIYPSLIRMLGGVPIPFGLPEEDGFQPDVQEMAAKISLKTKLIILNSPSNPTGTVYSDAVQSRIAQLAVKHDLWVISDEIYARILYGRSYTSISTLPEMSERTVIVDGFSKSFAMTGWRLGYAVAPATLVSALHLLVVNTYTCASEFIQRAAVEALRDRNGAANKMVAQFEERRDQFIAALNRVPGFRCMPPEGAFYAWVNTSGTGMTAERVCQLMLEEAGVAGIPGRAFGAAGGPFVRFSFASSKEQLAAAVQRIEKLMAKYVGEPAALRESR
jgi:aspartate aminotransferase